MILIITYFVFFVINSLVIYLANTVYPQQIVLGTLHITKIWAIIHSMGTLALVNIFAIPPKTLTNKEWIIRYFLINLISIWIITRFADQLGLGIASWQIVLILTLILTFVQYFANNLLSQPKRLKPDSCSAN